MVTRMNRPGVVYDGACVVAFFGLFACLALFGALLFAPAPRHVTLAPGGKIGLRAAALVQAPICEARR